MAGREGGRGEGGREESIEADMQSYFHFLIFTSLYICIFT